MAWEWIECRCGHKERLFLKSGGTLLATRVAALGRQLCGACGRQRRAARAKEEARRFGFPELIGTAAEIEWGQEIRTEKMTNLAHFIEDWEAWIRRAILAGGLKGKEGEITEQRRELMALKERLRMKRIAADWIRLRNVGAREMALSWKELLI